MPQHRHNEAHRKSYTEVQTSDHNQVHSRISALRLKRSSQDTEHGERMKKNQLKALILVLGLLHSKNLKLQTVPPEIC